MKKILKNLRPVLLVALGLVMAVLSAVTSPMLGNNGNVAQGALLLQVTPTPTPIRLSEIGSTDGIVLMAIFIVLVVIVPVMVWRRSWAR